MTQVAPRLSELEPQGLAPESDGWQQRRSSETRTVILEAAIDCLAQYGYARTTTQLIAKMARVSRGAMLHHYATKQDLIEAAIDYAFYRHMSDFSRAIRTLTEEERVDHNAGILLDWKSHLSREFKAYLELHVAARTDEELRAVFLPKAVRHDEVWRAELLQVFPEWRNKPDKFELTCRLVRSLLTGMVIKRDIWNDPEAESVLLGFLASLVLQIRRGKLTYPDAGEFPAIAAD